MRRHQREVWKECPHNMTCAFRDFSRKSKAYSSIFLSYQTSESHPKVQLSTLWYHHDDSRNKSSRTPIRSLPYTFAPSRILPDSYDLSIAVRMHTGIKFQPTSSPSHSLLLSSCSLRLSHNPKRKEEDHQEKNNDLYIFSF